MGAFVYGWLAHGMQDGGGSSGEVAVRAVRGETHSLYVCLSLCLSDWLCLSACVRVLFVVCVRAC